MVVSFTNDSSAPLSTELIDGIIETIDRGRVLVLMLLPGDRGGDLIGDLLGDLLGDADDENDDS